MTSRSDVSTLWRANTSRSAWPKSRPTTATTRTSVKKLAEIEKCDADPPSIRSRLPNGISTASKATEPTTNKDIRDFGSRNQNCGFQFGRTKCSLRTAYCLLLTVLRLRPAESFQILVSLLAKRTVG